MTAKKPIVVKIDGTWFTFDGTPYSGILIVEPSGIIGPNEGGIAYKPEKVINIPHEYNIRKLCEFFNEVCKVFDEHHENQKKLDEAEKRCNACTTGNCEDCDNFDTVQEALERYS